MSEEGILDPSREVLVITVGNLQVVALQTIGRSLTAEEVQEIQDNISGGIIISWFDALQHAIVRVVIDEEE